jgi:hypothetical protein
MSNVNVSLFRFPRHLSGANDNGLFFASSAPNLGTRHRRPAARAAFGRLVARPVRVADPYLLVLLADQEIAANRPEQARSLIEAAYAAFDQGRGS